MASAVHCCCLSSHRHRNRRQTTVSVMLGIALIAIIPRALATDSGAWQLVDPWLRQRGDLAMTYDSRRGVTVMFGGRDSEVDVCLGDTWEYDGQRWVRKSTSGPSPRVGHKMAYDSRRGVTVLFGGEDAEGRYGDTWEWDGATWTMRATDGPSPRYWPGLAYDEHRGVVVLYGGYDGRYPHDTWEWDGKSWSLRGIGSPPGLYSMVYDSRRQVLVLVGVTQTWEYDGTDWVRKDDMPSQSGGAAAYDSARGVTVRHGDYWGNNDTWEWDGVSWVRASRIGVGDVYAQGMSYDSNRGVTVIFGGFDGSFSRDTTWEWDGQAWTQRTTSPLGRAEAKIAYDAARGQTVLFGGYRHPKTGDEEYTLAWDGRQWSLIATTGPGEQRSHDMVYCDQSALTLLVSGVDTWSWNGAAWTWVTDIGPSQRGGHAMTYDRSRDIVVLFGGIAKNDNGNFRLNGETWEWNGNVWTRESTRGPSNRFEHAMTYDAARGLTVLFGGSADGEGDNGETWEWDGRRWTLAATTGPAPRRDHAMVYDEDRNVTVLHGGIQAGIELADMWEWDGVEWRERQVEGIPPRYGHGMAYDSRRGVTVMFGGWGEHSERLGDTWEFDPCVGLTKLKARCKASGGGRVTTIKVTVITTLPEGSTIPVDNTDLASNTTQRQRIPVNARGKARHKWPDQHGEHALTLADCPRMTQTVTCDP